MQRWADGGPCPLDGHRYGRVALFDERREHWHWLPGRAPTMWNLWVRLAREKGARISGVDDE